MSETLSELEKVLALLDKATGGELFILWLRNGSIKYPVATTKDRNIFIEASSHQKADDCRTIIGAINFLRQHGPAIADALRAVEGAAWIPCSERLPEHYEHVETWPPYDEQTYNFYAHRDGGTNGVKAGNWYHNDREGYDWQFSPTHWRRISAPLDAAGSAEGVGGG